jgi:NHL repeat
MVGAGSEEGEVRSPEGLALVSQAESTPGASGAREALYVADNGNGRVLDAGGRLVASWGGRGKAAGLFESPDGLAVDSAGDAFVADGVLDRIQEFTAHGVLLAVCGKTGTGLGELAEPAGVSIDCRGDLLVADTGDNRVAIFTGVAPRGCRPACWTTVRQPGPLHSFYQRIRARRGHSVAIVAAARKLASLFWCLLTREEDYAYQQPSLTRKKRRSGSFGVRRAHAGRRIADNRANFDGRKHARNLRNSSRPGASTRLL